MARSGKKKESTKNEEIIVAIENISVSLLDT